MTKDPLGDVRNASRHFRASSTENTRILSRIWKMEMDYRCWITGSAVGYRREVKQSCAGVIEISSERTIQPECTLAFDVHYPSFRCEEKYFLRDIRDRVIRKYTFAMANLN